MSSAEPGSWAPNWLQGEGQDDEALVLLGVVELHEGLVVLVGVAAGRGHVGDDNNLVLHGGEVKGLACRGEEDPPGGEGPVGGHTMGGGWCEGEMGEEASGMKGRGRECTMVSVDR